MTPAWHFNSEKIKLKFKGYKIWTIWSFASALTMEQRTCFILSLNPIEATAPLGEGGIGG